MIGDAKRNEYMIKIQYHLYGFIFLLFYIKKQINPFKYFYKNDILLYFFIYNYVNCLFIVNSIAFYAIKYILLVFYSVDFCFNYQNH